VRELRLTNRDRSQLKAIARLSDEERLELADRKANELWNYVTDLIQTHANNRVLTYDRKLADEVGTSYAAHAFINLRRQMHRMELIRLMALWDGPSLDRFSIPTILALILKPSIFRSLYRRQVGRWSAPAPMEVEDEEIREWAEAAFRRSNREWYKAAFQRTSRNAIAPVLKVVASQRLESLRDYRDRYIAHNLDGPVLANSGQDYKPPRYGQERRLLVTTCRVTDALNVLIRGASFDWTGSFRIANKYADHFWGAIRFHDLR
jgi:hypothetical protein